ncbi:MAG: hypothetical protein GTO22_18360 [Gemmatimonadales bacterium]|nr:hypothetical protein [Gemmatimonadales bacterium]
MASDAGIGPFLLDGQTVLLQDYLAVRPQQADRVAALVRAGKLVVGPWYVLADELLSSDEGLVRNLLVGRADGRRYGDWLALGYSPDAFGHPAALPTILAGFGIEYAMVLRGYGGEPGQERDLFRWIGPDGAAVLAYHFPPAGFEIGVNLPEERAALRQRWEEMRAMLAPRAVASVLLVMNGADHHALQPGVHRIVARLNELVDDHEFRLASPAKYFAALPAALDVPEVRGELRFSYRYSWTLQGVHSTRCRRKQAVAEAERLMLRWAEPQAALAWIGGGPDRRPLLDVAWRAHLLNCFHDSIGGCTTDEVARDVACRAGQVSVEARGILVDALHDRLDQDRVRARHSTDRWSPTLVLVNPSPSQRSGVVEATIALFRERVVVGRPADRRGMPAPAWPAPPSLVASDGTVAPLQVLDWYPGFERLDSPRDYPIQDEVAAFRVALEVHDVPALGTKAFHVQSKPAQTSTGEHVWVSGRRLLGAWFSVEQGSEPGFSIHDRAGDRWFTGVGAIVSERDEGDSYTFEPEPGDRPLHAQWGSTRAVWNGPLVAAVARDFTVGDRARGMLYARLDARSRLVRLVVEGENLRGNHRLRMVFPLPEGCSGEQCIADMQYGPVFRVRETFSVDDFPREWPVRAAPMHRYVSVPGGLTVFARGLFEYELKEGAVAVTLLRAVGDLSRGNLRSRPGHAGWPSVTPEAQELGKFRAELAVAPRSVTRDSSPAEWAEIEGLADEFHAPLASLMLQYGIEVPDVVVGPELEGDGLAFKAAKPSEGGDALVLRCVNLTSSAIRGAWKVPFPVVRARRVRLDETGQGELALSEGGTRLEFEAAPREVVTVQVER